MPAIGKATPFIRSDSPGDIALTCRGKHYRIRESDARRLLKDCREADLYSIHGHTRLGTLTRMKDYYRVKLDFQPAFCNVNRLNLLIRGIYWYAPVNDWCREAGYV